MTTLARLQCSSLPRLAGPRADGPPGTPAPPPAAAARAIAAFRRLSRLLRGGERPDRDAAWITWQVRALYREVPGLVLTLDDLQDAFGLDRGTSALVLGALADAGFLRADGRGFAAAPAGAAAAADRETGRGEAGGGAGRRRAAANRTSRRSGGPGSTRDT